MSPAPCTPDELSAFLRQAAADAGGAGIERMAVSGATAWCNTSSCSTEQAKALALAAQRPPPGFVVYKFGSRAVVGAFRLPVGEEVVLKYYYPRGLHKQLSYGLKGTRCRQSWLAALALQRAGIPTPPALMIAEWRGLGGLWWQRSVLATGKARGITLQDWVETCGADLARLDAMAVRLRTIAGRMDEFRIGHGDLKATNILVADDDSVALVDLDAVSILNNNAAWPAVRERDQRIFAGNWKGMPRAAQAFANVFKIHDR